LYNALDFWSPFVLGETRDRDLGKVTVAGQISLERMTDDEIDAYLVSG
jgi:hypothetical protein